MSELAITPEEKAAFEEVCAKLASLAQNAFALARPDGRTLLKLAQESRPLKALTGFPGHPQHVTQLRRAARAAVLALISTRRNADSARTLLMAAVTEERGQYDIWPLAVFDLASYREQGALAILFDGDPFEDYADPTAEALA